MVESLGPVASGIAVVVPCYELGRTLEESVDSVLAQTRPAAEIVVVDDGSTDLVTRQVLARLERPRTRVVVVPHAGVAAARNLGVRLCRSPYLVLLDADDVLADTYLERAASRLDSDPGLGFVSCAVQAFEGASYEWKPPSVDVVGSLTRGSVHISSMFRRTLWDDVGGFDPQLPAYEDLDFWLRALTLGFRGEVLEERLLFYRVREGSRYRTGIEPEAYRAAMERIIEKHRGLLQAHGLEALRSKESFLVHVIGHRESLERQRQSLLAELAELREKTRETRRTVAEKSTGREPAAGIGLRLPPAWLDSVLARHWESFLLDRKWMVRGRVAFAADPPVLLERAVWSRWDAGASNTSEEHVELSGLARLAPDSLDSIVVLALSRPADLHAVLSEAVRALEAGGSLVFAMSAVSHRAVLEGGGSGASEAELAATLAQTLPLDAFETTALGGLVTLTAALHNVRASDVPAPDFDETDSDYPVLVAATAVKPGRSGRGRHPRVRWRERSTPSIGANGGLILAYHRIASLEPDTHRLCVPAACFREHVRYLRERCTPMRLAELLWAARDGALPPRAVAITIDDGYLDALTAAAPILVEEQVPATFFLTTDRFDEAHEAWHDTVERILLTGEQLPAVLELSLEGHEVRFDVSTEEGRKRTLMDLHGPLTEMPVAAREAVLAQLGVWSRLDLTPRRDHRLLLAEEARALGGMPGCEVGSHSENHLLLPRHPLEVQQSELRRAKERLEALIDAPVLSFCYPFGRTSPELADVVRATPHHLAVTAEPGLVTASSEPMQLPRLEISGWDLPRFASVLEGQFRVAEPRAGGRRAQAVNDARWAENDELSRMEHRDGKVSLESRPQFLILDPTSRCNARCVMCPVAFRAPGDHGTDLPRSLFEKLRPFISAASHVNLFATGEPTIAGDLGFLVHHTRDHAASHAQVWVSTNGKAVPPELVDSLMAPGMGLQFSVDGGTPEVFEAIRRGIKWTQLCSSLDMVVARRGDKPSPRLSFSCTISKRNIHDLANIFALAKRYRVEQVIFNEEDPEVPEEDEYLLDESDRPVFQAQLPFIESTGIRHFNGLHFRGPDALRRAPSSEERGRGLHCRAPWKVFYLRADGGVRTCCTLRDSMGDLGRASFEEVWNGEQYVKLRRAFVEQKGIPAACYTCTDPLRTWGA